MSTQHDVREQRLGDDARRRLLATADISERRLDLAGVSTALLEAGDGPPVVLLHGPGAHAAAWLPVIAALRRSHRVIAPDLPGLGASVVRNGPMDGDRTLDWLGQLFAQTCSVPAVLVGHLAGGAIAARFAADHDHVVARLVLVTPMGLAPFEPAPEFGAVLNGYLTRPSGDSHDELWRACVLDLDGLRQRMGRNWDDLRLYNVGRARTGEMAIGLQTLLEQFGMQVIPAETLARIAVPTTLIWGRGDAIVRVAAGQAASRRYGWPLTVLETGNEPALEDPDAFLRAAFGPTEAS
jgi:pimeloyl-ACP methyl ester carboxylesterase